MSRTQPHKQLKAIFHLALKVKVVSIK